jgi:hypothetical protein
VENQKYKELKNNTNLEILSFSVLTLFFQNCILIKHSVMSVWATSSGGRAPPF